MGLTPSNKKLLFRSFETMCNVITQKIYRGQELNSLEIIDNINDLYDRTILKFPHITEDLNKILKSQFNSILKLSKDKGFLMVTEKIEKEWTNILKN